MSFGFHFWENSGFCGGRCIGCRFLEDPTLSVGFISSKENTPTLSMLELMELEIP